MKRILLIEDNLTSQELISDELINAFGLFVIIANDVSEGKESIDENELDLIICDYEMPDGTGDDIISYLSESSNSTPFIVFTGKYDVNIEPSPSLVECINDKDYSKLFKAVYNFLNL